MKIGFVVLTLNEDKHVVRLLSNLKNVSHNIFIVDSFSTDNTISLLKENKISFIQKKFESYGDQLDFAIKKFPFNVDYIMRIDADELMSPDLIHNLNNQKFQNDTYQVMRSIKFRNEIIHIRNYLPQATLRMFKMTAKISITNKLMDEKIVSESPPGWIDGLLLDDNLSGHELWWGKHKKYARLEAQKVLCSKHLELSNKKSRYYKLPYFIRALAYFSFMTIKVQRYNKATFAFLYYQVLKYRLLVDINILILRFTKYTSK